MYDFLTYNYVNIEFNTILTKLKKVRIYWVGGTIVNMLNLTQCYTEYRVASTLAASYVSIVLIGRCSGQVGSSMKIC